MTKKIALIFIMVFSFQTRAGSDLSFSCERFWKGGLFTPSIEGKKIEVEVSTNRALVQVFTFEDRQNKWIKTFETNRIDKIGMKDHRTLYIKFSESEYIFFRHQGENRYGVVSSLLNLFLTNQETMWCEGLVL